MNAKLMLKLSFQFYLVLTEIDFQMASYLYCICFYKTLYHDGFYITSFFSSIELIRFVEFQVTSGLLEYLFYLLFRVRRTE